MGNDNEMLKNIKIEIESYYDHYVYLADIMAVYQHISDVLETVKKNHAGVNFLKNVICNQDLNELVYNRR